MFLEHVISVLSQSPIVKDDPEKGDSSSHRVDSHIEDNILQAAIFALTAFFRFLFSTAYIRCLLMCAGLRNLRHFIIIVGVVVKLERKLLNKVMLLFLRHLHSNWEVVMV